MEGAWALGAGPGRKGRVWKKKKKGAPETPKKRGRTFGRGFAIKRRKLSPFEATQLLWYHIYPEHYVDEPHPEPEFEDEAPEWLRQMDFNPRHFFNLSEVFEAVEEIQGQKDWQYMKAVCRETGELAVFPVHEIMSSGDVEGAVLDFFNFPTEAYALIDKGDPEELWFGWIDPYLDGLAGVLNQMSPEGFDGWFEFGHIDSGDFGLNYMDCAPGGAYG